MKKQKKKLPFNVLRKSALAGLCCLTVGFGGLALAGCETAESDKAEAKWYSGTTNIEQVTQGVDGDYYFDTDDYLLYQKEEGSWKLIDSNFGKIETGTGSFLTGATAPATSLGKNGDTYLDYANSVVYQKINGEWEKLHYLEKGTNALNPILISSAQEFAQLGTQTDYTYYKLTADIDLRELNSVFNENGKLATNFVGEIDGDGHTIILNSEAKSNYSYVFGKIEGYFHNLTFNFPNIIEKEINFANQVTGETKFENNTTTGSIVVPSSGTNWSPYVNIAMKANVTFKDCTNALDVVLPTYGSLFLGGYAADGHQILQDESVVGKNRAGCGVLLDTVKVSFINCKNTAHVEMEYASMLYGNPVRLPQMADLTIENCVNEGTLIGYKDVGLFCGKTNELGKVDTNYESYGDLRYQYMYEYFDYGDYDPETGTQTGMLAKLGDNLKNTGTMSVIESKQLYTVDETTKEFTIKNVTAGNSYEINKRFMIFFAKVEGERATSSSVVVLSKTFTAETSEDISTGIKDLDILTDKGFNAMTNKTCVEYTGLTVEFAHPFEYTMYIVTDNDTGVEYYYLKIDEAPSNFGNYQATYQETSVVVYEYDADNNIIARSN